MSEITDKMITEVVARSALTCPNCNSQVSLEHNRGKLTIEQCRAISYAHSVKALRLTPTEDVQENMRKLRDKGGYDGDKFEEILETVKKNHH